MEKKQRIRKISDTVDRDNYTNKRPVGTLEEREKSVRKVKRTQTGSKRRTYSGKKRLEEQTERSLSRSHSGSGTRRQKTRPRPEGKNPNTKRRRKKRRRKSHLCARLIQIVLVLALIGVLFFVISNFGEANKLNNKGMEAYESGDYETAAGYFLKAIDKDGSNYEYYMNNAMALSGMKMYSDAMTSFDRAVELAAGESEVQLVQRAKGISLLYQGSYDLALEAFDLALQGKEERYSSVEIDILYYKAETLDKAGRYVDSVMIYSDIVESENSADAYMLRGMEYVKVGDFPSAESDLRTAIKKDKKNYDIYWSLYQALTSQKKYDQAAEILEEALKLGGSKGDALVNQGKIYMKLGDFTSAEEKLTKALDKGEITANLAMAELSMEKTPADYTAATNYFETYLASVTNDAEAYNKYGLCLMETKKYEQAEEIFTKGVALNDRLMDRVISKNQISAAENAGHWANALEYIEVYLQKYSDDSAAIKEKEFIQTRIR